MLRTMLVRLITWLYHSKLYILPTNQTC